jgi:hypothetical protein
MKLSLSTSTTLDVISKKIRNDNNEENDANEKDLIPEYLQTTNKLFQFIITTYIKKNTNMTTNKMSLEDLQSLAILKHQIARVNQQRKLWEIYLKSGTGQWETQKYSKVNVNERRLWPNAVKSKASLLIKSIITDDEQTFYETIVNNHLKELDEMFTKYQYDYNRKKDDFKNSLTMKIEQVLDTFVQYFGIEPLEMKLNYKIAILQYEYEIHLLVCEYRRHEPTEYQVR